MKTVRIYLLKTETVEPYRDEILKRIPQERADKALRFKREAGRLLSLGGAFLIWQFAGPSYCDEKGKPRAESIHFNISHSGDLVGIALCGDEEIGFDIEETRAVTDSLVNFCLTKEEKRACEQGVPFLDLYVAKESLGKAEGDGLRNGVRTVPALPTDGKVGYAGRTFYRHSVFVESYSVSVTLENSDFETVLEWVDDVGRFLSNF